jgi:hypothetical protein
MRPINELRMKPRWKLGQALAKVERGQGARSDLTSSGGQTKLSFRAFLTDLGLDKSVAVEAQRIGTMPDEELACAFDAREVQVSRL